MELKRNFVNSEDFKLSKKHLGRGSIYDVQIIESTHDRTKYVAKILRDVKYLDLFNSEYTVLSKLNYHPAIIKFIGASFNSFEDPEKYQPTIITEYATNNTLDQFLNDYRDNSQWTSTKKHICLLGIAAAMNYLHANGITHRDLSPSCVLLDDDFYPKVSGFKHAFNDPKASLESEEYELMTSLYFRLAPEVLVSGEHGPEADVYSFSILAYKLVTRKEPYNSIPVLNKVIEGYRPAIPNSVSPKMRALIERCWHDDPEQRPSFGAIFKELSSDFSYVYDDVDEDEVSRYLSMLEESSPLKKMPGVELAEQKREYEAKLKEQKAEIENLRKQVSSQAKNQKKIESELRSKSSELQALQKSDKDKKAEIKRLQDELKKSKKKSQPKPAAKSINVLDEQTIQGMDKIERIGLGSGGEVFKVALKEIYALKEMSLLKHKEENFRQFLSEYELMCMLHHPNILQALGIFLSSATLPPSILLEFCPSNLESAVESGRLTREQLAEYAYQIAEGMRYVHFNKIIHRDLKPTNILVAKDGTVKIGDFGVSKLMSVGQQTSMTRGVGTQKFMAPEIINEEESYDEKVDVYSFGVVLFFMLSGGQVPKIKLGDILKGKKAELPESFTGFAKKLIYACWSFDAKDRPSFKEIVADLAKNKYEVVMMTGTEKKNVEVFVKQHQAKIPPYDE